VAHCKTHYILLITINSALHSKPTNLNHSLVNAIQIDIDLKRVIFILKLRSFG